MSAARCVPHVIAQAMQVLLLSSVLLTHTFLPASQAQITLDGSLGPRGPLVGPHYRIGAEFGQLQGSNLFHSFGQFNVRTGESAAFTGPRTVANIIGRVTGGQLSSIDGQLRSEIIGANLFLLNPSGVMFGPNASLEISGAFHVSTADFLRFADGATFSTHLSRESVLTVAPPAAFGFLGANPASITIQGSSLQVSGGHTLSVVGGDIDLVGQGPRTADSVPTLGAPGGRIHIASVAAAGEVPVNLSEFHVDAFGRLGRVALSQGAFINTSGNGGGVVLIRSGHLLIDGSAIFADNLGDVDGIGFGVDLRITGDAVLTKGALITTDSLGAGRARDLRITAGSVFMTDAAQISSVPFDVGDGGNVVVQVGQLTLTGGAQILSTTFGLGHSGVLTIGATDTITITGRDSEGNPSGLFSNTLSGGDAGRVFVSAPTLRMDGGRIQATTTAESRGNAGDIEVRGGRLTLTGGAQIDISTRGIGRSGELTVVATETVAIAGSDSEDNPSGLFGIAFSRGDAGRLSIAAPTVSIDGGRIQSLSLNDGNAGSIALEVGRLTLTGGAQVSSSTRGAGRGGQVTVNATEAVLISGRDSAGIESAVFSQTLGPGDAGSVVVTTPHLTLADGGRISADTGGDGRAGDVVIQAGRVALASGAQIRSGSGIPLGPTLSVGAGQGGTVTVTATDTVTITGQDSGLSTSTSGGGGGGDVILQAQGLTLTDGARLAAGSTGAGAAGSVTVTAQDAVRLTGSTVTTSTQGSGDAGRVVVTAPTVEIADGRLSAVTSGVGKAGSVTVAADRLTLSGQAQIDSSSSGPGPGGQVTITAREAITLTGSGGLASNATSQGAAGTVTVTTPTLQMEGPVAIEARTTGDGDAGNVDVHVERLTLAGGARIGSTSGLADTAGTVMAGTGHGGTVTITATTLLRITGHDSLGTPSGVFSQTFGPGDAGSVTVTTPHLTLADGGRMGAETGGAGRGGDVVIQAGSLTLTSGAQINSSSGITTGATVFVGSGAGGTVTVTASDPVTLSGPGSGLFTRTAGPGQGGSITLQAPRVGLTDAATISAESTGLGNAGNVTVTTQDTLLLTHGSVVTRATQADGGNIQLMAPNFLRLRDSHITAEVGGGPQTVGGNITIDPQFVLLQNSQIVANAFEGQGGNIRIQAQRVFLADPASTVTATSRLGIDGAVAIQAPVVSISGAVAPLPQAFAQVAEILRSRCAERLREGTVSRFVVGGRDGVPLEPGSLLLSPLERVGQEGGVPGEGRGSQTPEAPPGRVWDAQAHAPGGLEVECARWRGKPGTAVTPQRLR